MTVSPLWASNSSFVKWGVQYLLHKVYKNQKALCQWYIPVLQHYLYALKKKYWKILSWIFHKCANSTLMHEIQVFFFFRISCTTLNFFNELYYNLKKNSFVSAKTLQIAAWLNCIFFVIAHILQLLDLNFMPLPPPHQTRLTNSLGEGSSDSTYLLFTSPRIPTAGAQWMLTEMNRYYIKISL